MSANEYEHFANNWDTQNAFDTVRREALHEGINEAKVEVVKNLLLDFGFTDEQAAKAARYRLTSSVKFVQLYRIRSKIPIQRNIA